MFNRRLGVVIFVMMALVLALGACVAPPAGAPAAEGDEAAAEGPVTVTWAFWGSPEEKESHARVADAFMAEHPEIQIELWHQPWGDYFTKIQALWASGDTSLIPDIAFLWPTPQYAAEGVLENLDPYIEQAGYNLDDYWPSLLESASYEGSVYGFPRDIGFDILYFNQDLFDEVGLDYPTAEWTWDDLTEAAEALQVVDGNGRVERYGLAMEGGKWTQWLNQNGAAIFDDMRNPSTCTLDSPEAIAAISFFGELMNNGLAMRDADLSQAGGDSAVFQSGETAMIIQNSSRVSGFNAAEMNYDVQVVPIPAGGQQWASAGGAAWVMSAGSDTKDEAWTFLEWLQSTEGGQKVYTESGEIFPALQSVAESDAFMGLGQPANRQAFLDQGAAAGVGGFGYFPEWGELNGSIISPALQQVWAGEATADEVLPGVCEQVNTFLADNGYPK